MQMIGGYLKPSWFSIKIFLPGTTIARHSIFILVERIWYIVHSIDILYIDEIANHTLFNSHY